MATLRSLLLYILFYNNKGSSFQWCCRQTAPYKNLHLLSWRQPISQGPWSASVVAFAASSPMYLSFELYFVAMTNFLFDEVNELPYVGVRRKQLFVDDAVETLQPVKPSRLKYNWPKGSGAAKNVPSSYNRWINKIFDFFCSIICSVILALTIAVPTWNIA